MVVSADHYQRHIYFKMRAAIGHTTAMLRSTCHKRWSSIACFRVQPLRTAAFDIKRAAVCNLRLWEGQLGADRSRVRFKVVSISHLNRVATSLVKSKCSDSGRSVHGHCHILQGNIYAIRASQPRQQYEKDMVERL